MKRAAPELSEDKVLLRALRDFNLGKLTSDDTSIFMGLLNDLFPKTLELVPRAIDTVFEGKVRTCRRSGPASLPPIVILSIPSGYTVSRV
jgi:hypothetical protein